MADQPDRPGRGPQTTSGLLGRVAGVVAGLTALIAAVGGLLVAVHNYFPTNPGPSSNTPAASGTSAPVEAASAPGPAPAPAPPAAPDPAPVGTSWSATSPQEIPQSPCPCVGMTVADNSLHLQNNCPTSVIVEAMRDAQTFSPASAPPFQPAPGRMFASVVLKPGEQQDLTGVVHGAMAIGSLQCPVVAAVLPPPPPPACFVKHSAMRAAGLPYERTWCAPRDQSPMAGQPGQACTCAVDGRPIPGTFLYFSPQPDD